VTPRRFRGTLLVIVALGFAWRIVYILVWRRAALPMDGDGYYYSAGANLLAQGKGFLDPFALIAYHVHAQSANHPPLYELWLAIPSVLTGGHASQLTDLLWSAVLGTATIALIGVTGREIAGPRVGLIAAGIAAAYPNLWVHDGGLLSETMAIFTATLVILLAYRLARAPSIGRAVALGAAVGAAALARSELILALPLILVPVLLRARAVPMARRIRLVVIGGATTAVVLAPWIGYNLTRFDEHVLLSSQLGGTLAAANCDRTYYGPDMGFKSFPCASDYIRRARSADKDESVRDARIEEQVTPYVRAHITRLPVVIVVRWLREVGMWRPLDDIPHDMQYWQRERWAAQASMVSWYPVAGLAIAGALVLRRRRVSLLPLAAVCGAVMLAVGMTFAQTRYRAPMEVPIVLLAAVGVDALWRRYEQHRLARGLDAALETIAAVGDAAPVTAGG
jgi:4-amino-4-deoxy-L-arabinose transferase-like glycosyltransferase